MGAFNADTRRFDQRPLGLDRFHRPSLEFGLYLEGSRKPDCSGDILCAFAADVYTLSWQRRGGISICGHRGVVYPGLAGNPCDFVCVRRNSAPFPQRADLVTHRTVAKIFIGFDPLCVCQSQGKRLEKAGTFGGLRGHRADRANSPHPHQRSQPAYSGSWIYEPGVDYIRNNPPGPRLTGRDTPDFQYARAGFFPDRAPHLRYDFRPRVHAQTAWANAVWGESLRQQPDHLQRTWGGPDPVSGQCGLSDHCALF